MIPNIGILEIAIVLVIALLVFGPRKLPDLGRSLGRGLREFREGVSSVSTSVDPDGDHHEVLEAGDEEPAGSDHGPVEVDVEEVPAPRDRPDQPA